MAKQLRRKMQTRAIAGVCSGIAQYFDLDPVLIRLLWLASVLLFGSGVFLYLAAWVLIPKDYQ